MVSVCFKNSLPSCLLKSCKLDSIVGLDSIGSGSFTALRSWVQFLLFKKTCFLIKNEWDVEKNIGCAEWFILKILRRYMALLGPCVVLLALYFSSSSRRQAIESTTRNQEVVGSGPAGYWAFFFIFLLLSSGSLRNSSLVEVQHY